MHSIKLHRWHLTIVMMLINNVVFGQNEAFKLHLRNGTIMPPVNISVEAGSEGLRQNGTSRAGKVVIIQFFNIPDEQCKAKLKDGGIELLDYVPDNAYTAFVHGSPDVNLLILSNARSLIELTAAQKIQPLLLSAEIPAHVQTVAGKLDLWVSYPPAITLGEVKKELKDNGFEMISDSLDLYQIVELRIDKARLEQLADLPWVQYVAEKPAPTESFNDKSTAATRANVIAAGLPFGYKLDGEGVVIGIGDTGKLSEHIDVSTRVISYTTQGSFWHGLHVAGTAAGAGFINEKYKGYAPKAHLLIRQNTAILRNASDLVRDFGMIVTNNSYGSSASGCSGFGSYSSYANMLDRQAKDLPHLLHVFAAGNSGLAAPCNGLPTGFGNIIGDYTSAKNVISVGRTESTGVVASQSSKGPVQDGRIKPELIAPGASITSTTPGDLYQSATGTSMASPAVTGGIALLYQQYRQLHGQQNPKNALIKALLCNGASDKGLAGPDYSNGFGMMNLLRSVKMLEKGRYFSGELTNNAVNQHQIDVPANTAFIKVMLYWNDPAASMISGAKALVNNLDLSASVSGNSDILPLVPNPANPLLVAVSGIDSVNNIEQIVVESPVAGIYSLKVTGTKIPSGPQEYFLVYDVIERSTELTYPTGSEHLTTGEIINISWDSYGNPSSTFAVSYSLNNGLSWVSINGVVPAGTDQLTWTVPDTPTGLAKIRLVQNETGTIKESGSFSIMGLPVITMATVQCQGYAAVQWTAVSGASDYELMRLQGDEMKPVALTAELKYTFKGLSRDSTYYFSVRPRINGIPGSRASAIKWKPDNGTCSGTISDRNLGIDSIISPLKSGRLLTSTSLSALQPVTIGIRNFDDQKLGQAFEIGYSVGDAAAPIHWETISSELPAGGYLQYTFSKMVYMYNPGIYAVNVFIKIDGDPDEANNQKTVVVKQYPNPRISLPYLQDFESVPEQTLLFNATGLENADNYDFIPQDNIGRLRTYVQPGLAYSGTKALTLDADIWDGNEHKMSVQGTFNLAGYDCKSDEVRLAFKYRQHGLYQHYGDIGVYVRGKDTDQWISAFDYNSTSYLPAGKNFKQVDLDVSNLLKKNSQQFTESFQIMWRQKVFYPAQLDGYTIDDIKLFSATSDLAVQGIIQPSPAVCSSNYQELGILIKNNGNDNCFDAPFRIMVDGSVVHEGKVPLVEAGKDTLYSFKFSANLHLPGDHIVTALVQKAYDVNPGNDTIRVVFTTPPVISSFPYLEDFEDGQGGWQTSDPNSAWQFGRPASAKIKGAASGVNAWKTNLTGPFQSAGTSYLYSPCFDISGMEWPTLSFSTSIDLEVCNTGACDIAYVEYNTGHGWIRLNERAWSTNWYNYQDSWNFQDHTRWHVSTVRVLSWMGPYIRFRFVLDGKSSNSREGIAIDDIQVYDFLSTIAEYIPAQDPVIHENMQGNEWIDVKLSSSLVASVNPNNQNLGRVIVTTYLNDSRTPAANGQYYLPRSFSISASEPNFSKPVGVRLYFMDSEVEGLITAPDKTGISKPLSAYDLAVTKYSGSNEDGDLMNNSAVSWTYYPKSAVHKVPYMNGYYVEFNTGSFSEFWLAGDYIGVGTQLPVTLVSFSAKRHTSTENKESVLLAWETTSEKEFSHFEIEVARNEKDLIKSKFSKISDVAGATNSAGQIRYYTFTDNYPMISVVNYYRLKLVDNDGSYRYSAIRAVNFDKNAQWKIFPNPASEHFEVEFEEKAGEIVRINILDLSGKQIMMKTISATGTIQKAEIDLSDVLVAPGLYLIRMASRDREQTFKIIMKGR